MLHINTEALCPLHPSADSCLLRIVGSSSTCKGDACPYASGGVSLRTYRRRRAVYTAVRACGSRRGRRTDFDVRSPSVETCTPVIATVVRFRQVELLFPRRKSTAASIGSLLS